jgi:hypothetical protein
VNKEKNYRALLWENLIRWLLVYDLLLAPGDFGNIQSFNSISKISLSEIANSSLDTAVQENTTVWLQ